MALKDKKKAVYLSCAGAIGGIIGLALGIIMMIPILSAILQMGAWRILPFLIGVITSGVLGAILGAAIGLMLKDKKKAVYFSCAGTALFVIGFPLLFVIGDVIKLALLGVIFGAGFGLALNDKKRAIYLSVIFAILFAVGPAILFSIGSLIWGVVLNTIHDSFGDALGGYSTIGILGIILRGIIVLPAVAITGAAVGVAFGLALKDKKKTIYLSFACSSGFVIGFILATIGEIIGFVILSTTGLIIGGIIGVAIGGVIIGTVWATIEE